MLRAIWYEGTAQLLSLTELKSYLFELYFIGWTIKLMKEGRKPEYPEKTPGDELQKMPHTTARRFKPQTRLEPAQWHWWQARKADMLTVTPRVVLFRHGLTTDCYVDKKLTHSNEEKEYEIEDDHYSKGVVMTRELS